jgi:hypothetical protein
MWYLLGTLVAAVLIMWGALNLMPPSGALQFTVGVVLIVMGGIIIALVF